VSYIEDELVTNGEYAMTSLPSATLAPNGTVREYGRVLRQLDPAQARWRFLAAAAKPDGGIVFIDELRRSVFVRSPSGHISEVASPLANSAWYRPISVQTIDSDLLVADQEAAHVVWIASGGSVKWQYDCKGAGWNGGPTSADVSHDRRLIYVALPESNRVIGVDRQGAVAWSSEINHCGTPVGISACADGGVIVTDAGQHRFYKIRKDGTIAFSFGLAGHPDSIDGFLNTPNFTCETAAGTFLVSDTKNNRVVEVTSAGDIVRQIGSTSSCGAAPGLLWAPHTAVELSDGTVLIAERLNGRILKVSQTNGRYSETTVLGDECLWRASLQLPRGAGFTVTGDIRITDCYNNRILLINSTGRVRWYLHQLNGSASETRLWWPRFWTGTDSDAYIADGRRQRLIRVNKDQRVRAELDHYHEKGRPKSPFEDPHHVDVLRDGRMLVTDAGANAVVEVDWSGHAKWTYR
jgi:hypothetical protein